MVRTTANVWNTTLAWKQCYILVFFTKKIYKKDFIFLNILCDKCLFLSSYGGCLPFSEIPNIALATASVKARCVYFILFIRLDSVQMIFLLVRAFWILQICYRVSAPTCFFFYSVSVVTSWPEGDGVVGPDAPGSVWRGREQTRATGHQSPRQTSCCDVPVRRVSQNMWRLTEGLKTCKMLWIEACCYSCAMPLDVFIDFVFRLLTGAPFFHQKKKKKD